jgi:carbon monoxide dehydrogenase subunit G
MEVKLDKRYDVPAGIEQAWAVLADVHATAACMPGAQITEQVDATHYKGTVKSKIGPATMMFAGDIEVMGLDAGRRELRLLAKGADKSGSSAAMDLTAHVEPGADPGAVVLVGSATVTVSGKLAQFGSRLLVPVSDAILTQFADNFRRAAAAVPVAVQAAAEPSGVGTPTPAPGAEAPADLAPTASAVAVPPAPAPLAAPRPPAEVQALNPLKLLWIMIRNWFAGLFGRKGQG